MSLNVGYKPNQFSVWVGYRWWKNKFGINPNQPNGEADTTPNQPASKVFAFTNLVVEFLNGVVTPLAARDTESLPPPYIPKDSVPLTHLVAVWFGAPSGSRGLVDAVLTWCGRASSRGSGLNWAESLVGLARGAVRTNETSKQQHIASLYGIG
jgi:hypothetical protein